jgi:hypothetical protein
MILLFYDLHSKIEDNEISIIVILLRYISITELVCNLNYVKYSAVSSYFARITILKNQYRSLIDLFAM